MGKLTHQQVKDAKQEREDDLVLRASRDRNPILGLRFVLPPEVHPEGNGSREKIPGIYLEGSRPGTSPTARMCHEERLLKRVEAEEWAAMVDRIAVCVPHFHDRPPTSNVEFVQMWYGALGRHLGKAIDATDERRMQLREVFAALTGRTY